MTKQEDAQRYIGGWVGSLAAAFRRGLDSELAPFDVSASQWAILSQCYSGNVDTPGALANALPIDAAAVTRLLDRLEKKGLVRRGPHPRDRRSIRVELTKQGRTIVPKLRPLIDKNNAKFLEGLSQAELDNISSLFPKMLRNAAAGRNHS